MTSALDELRTCLDLPPDEARSLPFSAYTDPDVLALECERIFRRDWIPVCAERSLSAPGDYFALDLAGEPVVVLRGADRALRALSNSCRHRGTPIADPGFGRRLRLVCPFHAWTYDDTGLLRGVPYEGDAAIDRKSHSLARFACDVWAGVVFVCLQDQPPPLAERLAGIDPHLAGFDLPHYDQLVGTTEPQVWNANWKLIVENGIESYHLFQVHRRTLEPHIPTRAHTYLAGGPAWALTPARRTTPARCADADPPSMGAFEREHYLLASIPPSFVGALTAETWGFILVHPLNPEQSLVSTAGLCPRGGSARISESPFGSPDFTGEDQVICESVQRGMHARAGRPGRLVGLERIVVDHHRYLSEQLFD